MAMTTASGRGRPLAEINVTPMADIMIVLLIIFMVATPLIINGPVKRLPPARNSPGKTETIAVAIGADHTAYLDNRRLDTTGELLPLLQERMEGLTSDRRVVYLKADETLPYAEVMAVMDLCREAGAEQVALMTAPRS